MTTNTEAPKQNKGGRNLLIILAVLLLGLNIFQFWWSTQNEKAKNQIISEKETIITEKNTVIDSQLLEIDSIASSFEKIKAEKEALGLDVSSLEEQLEKIRKDRNYYARNFIKPSVRKEMEATIKNYKNLLNEQENTINNLTATRDSLFKENVVLKEEMTHIHDTILELEKIQHDQEEELNIARRLKASGINITAVKNPEKGKTKYEATQIYRSKDLVHTQIKLNIDPNPVALIEQKEIYVQILDPDKKVIYNNDKGSGTFTIQKDESNSRDIKYTVKQNITYKRKTETLDLTFENPTEYSSGIHTVHIWCENIVIGTGTFTVK